jgi:hypothetical protein
VSLGLTFRANEDTPNCREAAPLSGLGPLNPAILILLERRHLAGQWNISIDSKFEKSAT